MSNKSNKSHVQRRREQVKKQQEQHNRIISIAAGVLVVVVLSIIGILVFQNLRGDETGDSETGSAGTGTEMVTDRPLAEMDPAERNAFYSEYPAFVIDPEKDYEALIETTKGDIRLDLFVAEATATVNNFVFLANEGFYDGVPFHRVLDNFMAQTGDPTGTGTGGPGYAFADETDNELVFDRPGLLAMANSGPNTNGSQFFITFVETPHLNGAHTIFGEVIEGSEVLAALTRINPELPDQPEPDLIERVTIFEIEQ